MITVTVVLLRRGRVFFFQEAEGYGDSSALAVDAGKPAMGNGIRSLQMTVSLAWPSTTL